MQFYSILKENTDLPMSVDIQPNNVDDLIQALITALSNQEHSMTALKNHIDEQLKALRSQQRSTLEKLTAETSGIVNTLQILESEKNSHIKQLGKLLDVELNSISIEPLIQSLEKRPGHEEHVETLKQLFHRIPAGAKIIRESGKELAYSLQYALHLGHQMIEAIQGAVSYPPVLVYTAEGSKKLSASKRMMVNKVG